MSVPKTYILTTMPNRMGNLEIQELQQSPAFRKTIVPGGPGKSLLGIRPALKSTSINREPVSIEIKVENQLVGSENESQNIRKRQRLDHLTIEEKLMRRKLKNRVAAQTARDRKKARMDELEDMVLLLEKDVERLKSENSRLQNVTMLLETENKFLKEKIERNEQSGKEVLVIPPVVIKQEIEDVPRNESFVDSLEQAEGAGIDNATFSLDDAFKSILESTSDDTDDLLDFLQQCSSDLFSSGLEENTPKFDTDRNEEPPSKCRKSEETATVVGPTSEELESIKELIRFDHVYVKECKDEAMVPIEEAMVEVVDCNSLEEDSLNSETISTVGCEIPTILLTVNDDIISPTNTDTDCEIIHEKAHLNPKLDGNIFLNSPCGSTSNESGYDSPKSPYTDSLLDDNEWEDSFTDLFPDLSLI